MSAAALRNVQDAAYEKGASAAAASARSGPSPFLKRAHFLSKGVRLNLCRFTSKLIGLFNEMDEDHSGRLSPKEFFDGLSAANIGMSHDEFDQFARLLDKSGDGQIDYNELVEGLYQLSTEHESSLDSQFMPGGEMLPFPVEPPVSRDAAAKGIWPVATSPPGIRRERRAGIVTPWAERAAHSLKGMTATELSRRKWRDAKKNGIAEEADYRWPALPVQSKRPKPYQLPRCASPRATPWSPQADVAEMTGRQSAKPKAPRGSKKRQQVSPTAPQRGSGSGRPLSRGEAAKIARAEFYAKRKAREDATIKHEKDAFAQVTRSVSPYSLAPTPRLTKELFGSSGSSGGAGNAAALGPRIT